MLESRCQSGDFWAAFLRGITTFIAQDLTSAKRLEFGRQIFGQVEIGADLGQSLGPKFRVADVET